MRRWRGLLNALRAWDDRRHRARRGARRRALFDGESQMHFAMFETLYGAMRLDPRLELSLTCSWSGGLKVPLSSLRSVLEEADAHWVPYRRAKWRKWDLYVSSCFDVPWLARPAPWADTFHGVGEKWTADGSRLYMAHPLAARYDRLLCPNRRLAEQFAARPAFLKTPESLRLTGLARSDPLLWLNTPEVRARLRAALAVPDGVPLAVFAPTWGPDGALALHGEELVRACREAGAELAVKLHACSYLPDPACNGGVDWRGRLDAWARRYGFRHLPHADLASLLLAADVLIADFGSAAVEFCLLDRPLVFFRSEAQAARTGGDRFQFDALCAAGGGARDAAELRKGLAAALRGGDGAAAAARRALRETFFHDAGNATANGLRELYALMELDLPAGLVEAYRERRRRRALEQPAAFLGLT